MPSSRSSLPLSPEVWYSVRYPPENLYLVLADYAILTFFISGATPKEMSNEQVMVVTASRLRPFAPEAPGQPGTLITHNTNDIIGLIRQYAEFIPRSAAEHDPSFKQIIPYVAIRHGQHYLLLQRTENQTEKRLHNKFSLGIGGHINPSEAGAADPLMDGLRRELEEEIWVPEPHDLTFQGIIHDESSDVSSVHLGLFHVIDLKLMEFEIREKDNMTGQWVSRDELEQFFLDMESWSQVVYTHYIKRGDR